jgi:2-polyprenyl-3-methyl-5-hydroxy-6-metoxy-1,4-benzoquinol methylase
LNFYQIPVRPDVFTPGEHMSEVDNLIQSYEELLLLYQRLEAITDTICSLLESGDGIGKLTEPLGEKKAVVEKISAASEKISHLKRQIAENGSVSDSQRTRVNEIESALTDTVNRVVEQGQKSYELMMNRGVKISRR